ncbi:MOSC domain-containing protein [Oceanicoccus sp. KOV_DT_Chl]|uniref:MOSC domain-containing protein n=1 Tax=Oceanicoccus sp. KOV_DT_Chl TaxID=1904639 RepID=UPI000C7A6F4B|nr:MOSC domain-containing protein [Oceanicoccus sp. KOV_DT_Chl]
MNTQQRLFSRYISELRPGTLQWIGLRPAHKTDMRLTDHVNALKGLGLEGDHRCSKTPGSARQVTLISTEYIQQIAHFSGIPNIKPATLRRNLVVSGINLNAMRYQQFTIGDALFEATALCHPCARIERALGRGAVAAMLGHGGLCCKILISGTIKIGDAVIPVMPHNL